MDSPAARRSPPEPDLGRDRLEIELEPGVHPVWAAFEVLRDQVERLVALNLAWSVQLLPAVAGLAFPSLPLPLRALLVGYSLVALPPAAMVVHAMAARAADGEEVGVGQSLDALRALAVASYRALAPLCLGLGALAWLVGSGLVAGQLALEVALRLAVLLGAVGGLYWGPLLVEDPRRSPLALLADSGRLVLRHPGLTLAVGAAALLAWLVGLVSVGGLFLVGFATAALLQAQLRLETRRLDRAEVA